jgi:hypothetical protein
MRAHRNALEDRGIVRHHVLPPTAAAEIPFGALTGAAVGAIAGPPGIMLGAFIGGAAGAALSVALERQQHDDRIADDRLDRDIEVIAGSRPSPAR